MADGGREFIHELLRLMRNLPAGGVPDWPAEINEYALRVKRMLTELSDRLDTRLLDNYERDVIEYAEQLKKKLEDAMASAQKSQAGGMVGNAMRIGGTLAYAHPLGQTLFWAGLATSAVCDMFTEWKGRHIQDLSQEINAILIRDVDSFRPLAGAIRRLDEALVERFGASIYDEKFQEFLRVAALPRERNAVPCEVGNVDNVEHRNNLIELARNRELIQRLVEISRAIIREDVIFLKLVSFAFFAMSFKSTSTNESVALQVAEFGVRGITMFLNHKRGKITLERIGSEIERMRKQLKAMKEVAPYLV